MKPDYYHNGGPDVIEVAQRYDLDFELGNALKYAVRAGRKPGEPAARDWEKARTYLQRWKHYALEHDVRPYMQGSLALEWMAPAAVADALGLDGARRQVALALLEAPNSFEEELWVTRALELIERELAKETADA